MKARVRLMASVGCYSAIGSCHETVYMCCMHDVRYCDEEETKTTPSRRKDNSVLESIVFFLFRVGVEHFCTKLEFLWMFGGDSECREWKREWKCSLVAFWEVFGWSTDYELYICLVLSYCIG